MTIENARALQEQLANEAIIRQRKNESKELADDCIRSIAIVGKAWGIPADETAHRQARAQQEQTWHVTIEWRCFNSTLHAGRTKAYVNLCLAMSAQAISQRTSVMRKTVSDNELFTFRVWLVRMGLNGDEFKNTRDHLLANLQGNRAWRYDKDCYASSHKNRTSQQEQER